jgi:hypothetical protein
MDTKGDKPDQEGLDPVKKEILQTEAQYQQALSEDAELDVLKSIRKHLKDLNDKYLNKPEDGKGPA